MRTKKTRLRAARAYLRRTAPSAEVKGSRAARLRVADWTPGHVGGVRCSPCGAFAHRIHPGGSDILRIEVRGRSPRWLLYAPQIRALQSALDTPPAAPAANPTAPGGL